MFSLFKMVLTELTTACLTGIHDLGCIGECMNLERLDLSVNNISNLVPLASLQHLSVLNLSSNKISNLGEGYFLVLMQWFLFFEAQNCLNHFFIQIYPDAIFCFLSPEESLRSCENLQNLNLAGNLISRYLKTVFLACIKHSLYIILLMQTTSAECWFGCAHLLDSEQHWQPSLPSVFKKAGKHTF